MTKEMTNYSSQTTKVLSRDKSVQYGSTAKASPSTSHSIFGVALTKVCREAIISLPVGKEETRAVRYSRFIPWNERLSQKSTLQELLPPFVPFACPCPPLTTDDV